MDISKAQICLQTIEDSITNLGYSERKMGETILGICMCTALIGKLTYNRFQLLNEMLDLDIDYFSLRFVAEKYGNDKGKYSREKLQDYLRPFCSLPKVLFEIQRLMFAIVSADGTIPDDVRDEVLAVTASST